MPRKTLNEFLHRCVAALSGVLFAASLLGSGVAAAAVTDLASVPLSSSSSSVVRPNVLFTLDDSGSMAWDYLPDYAGGRSYSGGNVNHCKVSNTCGTGEVPFQTNEYNGIAYNPRKTYRPPLNADGSSKPSQNSTNTSNWTAVKVDGFGVQSTSTINLTSGYPEVLYGCSSGCPTGWTNKKNGVDTNNPFSLRPSVSTDDPPLYAFPGRLTTGATVVATLHDGYLNQATVSSGTIFNGTLGISTPSQTFPLSGVTLARVGTTSTIQVTHNATTPPLKNGDTVVVSGGSCSNAYKSGGGSRPITVIDATHFTYVSSSGSNWSNPSCTVTVTTQAVTAPLPRINKSGTTVTVELAAAPTPALATGNLVTVANGSGTCDAGYRASSVPMTRISATSFSYTVTTAVGTASNTSCNITQVATTPPASPGIALSGSTVTVYKTSHGLVTGELVQVGNATSGSCGSGFRTSATVSVTRIDANTFSYSSPLGTDTSASNCKIDKMSAGGTATYNTAVTVNANPYYFVMLPTEYCDSMYLTRCIAATAPTTVGGVNYSYPAPVRFCKDAATAALPPGDAGAQTSGSGTINCQAKYSVGTGMNFQYARYGLFYRGDIKPSQTIYGNELYSGTVNVGGVNLTYNNFLVVDRSGRSDCASPPNCTYAEEMTNFANWYAYYRTRMQMMKSAAGHAFATLDNRYRVGFVTINESSSRYLPIGVFDATQKTNWYSKFYSVAPSGFTPLREALANAGRYFAGKQPGVLTGDPMEYACQQNFELLTTDGYWNGTDSNVKEIDGTTTMRNYDNVDSGLSARSLGVYDGGIAGASNTLADVAMYYYKTDLRNPALGNCTGALGADVCADIVPTSSTDTLATQHMVTFALGLADGLMTYQEDYQTATTGDFSKIKTGATGCPFSGSGTCNWPLPVHDTQSALDDLWHAAVNGRGTYYNARDPDSLARGLTQALAGINVRLAAAAASATSSPNITQTDRSIFSSTYRTTKWDGEVQAQLIDPATGNVEPTIRWSAQAQLDTLVQSDTTASKTGRHIYTFDDANTHGNNLKDFLYSELTSTEKAYFDNKCSFTYLTQCSAATLTASEIADGNRGENLVNYLRGSNALEPNIYRAREHYLGDTVNAKPAYVKQAQFNFTDAGYATFKANMSSRQGVLYMAANDGMLHALNADTGAEMWAYVPKIVMPNLYKLAETSYATLHQYYVDGSPEVMDIYVSTPTNGLDAGWHTILVGGLGRGGRGFYALEITDPYNPQVLWEVCSDSSLCAISDSDFGYSYGNPVITKRSTDGRWVVLLTSGYNNVSPGSGKGTLFVLDAITGAILSKTYTGAATDPPSGLAKISPWVDNALLNNTTRYVYGGDLNGDVWRFDLGAVGSTATPTATRIASLKDMYGNPQSVTTRPELGDPRNNTSDSLSGVGNPALFIATGRYLGTSDVSNTQIQTVYGFQDDLSKSGAAAYIGNPRSPNVGFNPFVRQYIYQPSVITRTTSKNPVDWSQKTGWYADLAIYDQGTGSMVSPQPSPGERVNLDPQLVAATLVVVSNVPESSACTIGGTSWMYSFDFQSGSYVATAIDHVVATKLGNALAVGIVMGRLPGGQLKAWVTTAGGEKLTVAPETNESTTLRRASWRELTE